MNKFMTIGRMTAKPEKVESKKDMCIAKFDLAVARKFDDKKTDFFNCVAFGKTAELILEHFEKGDPITLEGRIEFNEYTTKDREKRNSTQLVVDSFEFLPINKGKAKE